MLSLVSALVLTAALIEQTAPGATPQATGSARLIGRVLAANDGEPVEGATVRVSGATREKDGVVRRVDRTTQTSEFGRFEVGGLPAGTHYLLITPPAGFVAPRHPREVPLANERTHDVTVRLQRTGAIEGRVRDERGRPVIGAQVVAIRRIIVAGYQEARNVGAAATNDLGAFRLFHLEPGEYVVAAIDGPPGRSHPHDDRPVRRFGYAATYYPGVATRDRARSVIVSAGRDRKRVDFTLASTPLVTVAVTPMNSRGGRLASGAYVSLNVPDSLSLPNSTRYGVRDNEGTFRFDAVPPGDYALIVSSGMPIEEGAYERVRIGPADVSLNVRTNSGARVSGRIVVDGKPLSEVTQPEYARNVWMSASPPVGTYGPSYAHVPLVQVTGTDRFELTGLRGPMVVHGEIGGGIRLSIEHHGRNIAGRPMQLSGTETFTDVVASFTTRVAHLDVSLDPASAQGSGEPVTVVLFSDNPLQGIAYTTLELPAARKNPTVSLTRLPHGRHLLVAFPDPGLIRPTDAALLERLRRYAVPVALEGGRTTHVRLKVSRPAR